MRPRLVLLLTACGALIGAGAAHGQTALQDLSTFETYTDAYNLLAFGTADLNQEVTGSVAAENLDAGSNVQIAGNMSNADGDPNLYVANSVTLSSNVQVQAPTVYLPGLSTSQWTWNGSDTLTNDTDSSAKITINGGGQSNNPITSGTTPANWSSLQSKEEAVSSDLLTVGGNPTRYGATAGTISVNGSGQLQFYSSATSGVVVFNLNASLLSGDVYNGTTFNNGVYLDFNSGVDYVINVTNLSGGSYSLFSDSNFTGDPSAFAQYTLWNFAYSSSTTDITIGSGSDFYGSVLAPQDSITEDGAINGQVVATNFSDTDCNNSSELETDNFVVVSTPESGSFVFAALGLCGGAFAWRRWKLSPAKA